MRRDFSNSLVLLCLMVLFSPIALARPVSFLNATTIMSEHHAFQSEAMITRTLLPKLAVGFHFAKLRGFEGDPARELDVFALMVNWLVVRGMGDDWQSNLYLSAGAGGVVSSSAIEADFETRKYYLSARAQGWGVETNRPQYYLRARIGFAPYLSEMNGLHTWVLLQTERHSWAGVTEVLPMLRFFHQNILFELGSSFQGRSQFNFVTEF